MPNCSDNMQRTMIFIRSETKEKRLNQTRGNVIVSLPGHSETTERMGLNIEIQRQP
jgi:hypothetical protein